MTHDTHVSAVWSAWHLEAVEEVNNYDEKDNLKKVWEHDEDGNDVLNVYDEYRCLGTVYTIYNQTSDPHVLSPEDFEDIAWAVRFLDVHSYDETKKTVSTEYGVEKDSGLKSDTLRGFISKYSDDLEWYHGEDFGSSVSRITDNDYGHTMAFVLYDDAEGTEGCMEKVRPKYRKAGSIKRRKMKEKWSYEDPLNRIHGYAIVQDVTNKKLKEEGKKVLSISAICSTYYTDRKAIGKSLMKLIENYAESAKYTDIVLQLANEFSGMGQEEEEESSDEEEESSDEEEESEEEPEEYSEEEEDYYYPDDCALSVLSGALWKKCMRTNERGVQEYNLDQEYIEESLSAYFNCKTTFEEDEEVWEGTEVKERPEKPGEFDYGGFWYNKGKGTQKRLMKFYEMHGFKEDDTIFFEWGCFDSVPYPTMVKEVH